MNKTGKKLIIGSIFWALLMIGTSWYFVDHKYSEGIYNTVFVLACTYFFYYSGQIGRKSRKSAECNNC